MFEKPDEKFIQMFTMGRDNDEMCGLTNYGRVYMRKPYHDKWQKIEVPENYQEPEVF